MNKIWLAFASGLFLSFFGLSLLAEDNSKDTAAAEHTRNIKLKTKISLDMNNEMLRDILKEITSALQDKKKGTLLFRFELGVNMNSRCTAKVKDQSVEEILTNTLKQIGYGYIVISDKGSREDGYIRITKNPEEKGSRVEEKSTDEKKTPSKEKKELVKDKKSPPSKGTGTSSDERTAQGRLDLAKYWLNRNKKDKGNEILKEVIDKFPGTKAAAEAKKLLGK